MALFSALKPHDIERPVLDLSGDLLRGSMQMMIAGSEEHGGIERYVDAVKLKNRLFQQALGDGVDNIEFETFKGLCTFMATVRRRIGPWLSETAFDEMRGWLPELFDEAAPVDTRGVMTERDGLG